jgi:hypothetical protein
VILLWAIGLGLLAGAVRARVGGCQFQPPTIKGLAVIIVAFIPQFLAFYAPVTRDLTTQWSASLALVISQILLFVFVWLNRTVPAFWLMGIGLAMNFVVIVSNGGLMPISPETIHQMDPDFPAELLETGARLGNTKDVILNVDETRFAWLSDRFVVPDWYPRRVAFSLGDVFVAIGAFGLLWQAGACSRA